MKTMKIWRIIFMMLAAFSLASCSSDDDEVFFTIGTDGIPMPATYHNVSQADFQKFIVGYCWKETEMHRINDDGSIEEKDYGWDLFGWCGPSYYEFGDQTIIHYVENTGIPAYVHYTMNYKYDYSNNIYINDNNHFYFRLQVGKRNNRQGRWLQARIPLCGTQTTNQQGTCRCKRAIFRIRMKNLHDLRR